MSAHDRAAADRFRKAVIELAKGRCQAGTTIITVDVDAGRRCTGLATQAHHVEPRGMGGYGDNDPANGLSCCLHCHDWIESHREQAYELGLLRKHGQPRKRLVEPLPADRANIRVFSEEHRRLVREGADPPLYIIGNREIDDGSAR